MTKIEIRELKSMRDFIRIHKMYDSLSDRTKYFFGYPVFSWKPKGINPILWFLGNIALLLSLSPLKKIWWLFFPIASYRIVGAFVSNDLVGVCFLFKFSRCKCKTIAKNFGIVVKDAHQSRGIGSKLLEYLLSMALQWKVNTVHLEVLENNERAIKFYRKYNFNKVSYMHNPKKDGSKKLKMIWKVRINEKHSPNNPR